MACPTHANRCYPWRASDVEKLRIKCDWPTRKNEDKKEKVADKYLRYNFN